jgi:thiamine-phosphate pyrophosphorylase
VSAEHKPLRCYVTDRRQLTDRPLLASVEDALRAGVDWVQIREKDLSARELLALVRDALAAAARVRPEARILVNDRLDVAIAADAHGVHLGGASMPVADVVRWCSNATGSPPALLPAQPDRSHSGPALRGVSFLIGVSCHSVEEVRRAQLDGAGYVFLGPIFATPAKMHYGPPLGLPMLEDACRSVTIPVLAIGGITAANMNACLAAGAAGIAAIRLFQTTQRTNPGFPHQ